MSKTKSIFAGAIAALLLIVIHSRTAPAFDGANVPVGSALPATNALTVTPSDSADLSVIARGLYIGGAGDVTIIMQGDTNPVTLSAANAGTILPVRAKRVKSTGTTATNIVELY